MMSLLKTPVGRLRAIAFIEGVSFVVLVFIAMPLKYMMDMPTAVRITGMTHGVLFLMFVLSLSEASLARGWRPTRWGPVFLSSLVPFGTFIADKWLKRWDDEPAPA